VEVARLDTTWSATYANLGVVSVLTETCSTKHCARNKTSVAIAMQDTMSKTHYARSTEAHAEMEHWPPSFNVPAIISVVLVILGTEFRRRRPPNVLVGVVHVETEY